jgi:hypothetical protein
MFDARVETTASLNAQSAGALRQLRPVVTCCMRGLCVCIPLYIGLYRILFLAWKVRLGDVAWDTRVGWGMWFD